MAQLALLAIIVTLTALAGCASDTPDAQAAAAAQDGCVNRTSRTGSMILRSEPCIESTPESRAEARQRAQEMRDQQERMSRPRPSGSGQ